MKKHIETKNLVKKIEDTLIDAALGVAAGIALAPELGKKYYDDVKKKSAEFHSGLLKQSGKSKSSVKETVKKATEKVRKTNMK